MMNELRGIRRVFKAAKELAGGIAPAAHSGLANLLMPLSTLLMIIVALTFASGAWAAGGTKITLTSTTTSPTVGQAVTFTATVSGGKTTPTGTVTFTNVTNGTTMGTATLNSSGVATLSYTFTSVNNYSIQASYSGDSQHLAASTTESVTVLLVTPTVTVTSSPSTVGTYSQFNLIATINGGYQPSGTVFFYLGSNQLPYLCYVANGQCSIPSYMNGGPGQAGPYTAEYSGDGNNVGATSPALYINVVQDTPTVSLSVSPNPATYGQAVLLTANVSTPSYAYATGTVTFYDGTTVLGTSAVAQTSSGYVQSTLSYTFTTGGTHSVTATYSGDYFNTTSTSTAVSESVKPPTTTTLTSSVNPSAAGQATTLTATVAGSSPTGTVTFLDGTTTLGTATLNTSGVAALSYAFSSGTHSVTASYSGDTNNSASTSSPVSQTVNKATSATTLSATPNPVSAGQAATLTATVTGASPTGAVTFYDGTTALGSGTLNGSGVATLSYTYTGAGTHSITASYAGDANNNASVSPTVSLSVGSPTSTQLSSSLNLAAINQAVNLTATITGTNLTGTVTFLDGTNTIMAGVPISNGVASISAAFASKGTHSVTAAYSGDAVNAGSTSPAVSVVVYGETVTYFHDDAEGTPLAATDAAGNLLWSESYRAYGDPVQTPLDANNNLWYTGKPYDNNTNLTYLGARYYDPVLGRFMGIDPVGFREDNLQSFNRYTYANNNPLRYVDPDGKYGIGVVAGGNIDAGLGGGAATQAGSGAGLFFDTSNHKNSNIPMADTTVSLGAFTQSGSAAGESKNTSPGDSGSLFVAGASAGLGAGVFATNAKDAKQLLGPFDTFSLNLPFISAQFATDGNINVGSIQFGTPFSFSISRYTVTTTSAVSTSSDKQ